MINNTIPMAGVVPIHHHAPPPTMLYSLIGLLHLHGLYMRTSASRRVCPDPRAHRQSRACPELVAVQATTWTGRPAHRICASAKPPSDRALAAPPVGSAVVVLESEHRLIQPRRYTWTAPRSPRCQRRALDARLLWGSRRSVSCPGIHHRSLPDRGS